MRTCLSCKHLYSEAKPGCSVELRYRCKVSAVGWHTSAQIISAFQSPTVQCCHYENKHTTAKPEYKQPECEVWL